MFRFSWCSKHNIYSMYIKCMIDLIDALPINSSTFQDADKIDDGLRSFPSGHASTAMCIGWYISVSRLRKKSIDSLNKYSFIYFGIFIFENNAYLYQDGFEQPFSYPPSLHSLWQFTSEQLVSLSSDIIPLMSSLAFPSDFSFPL